MANAICKHCGGPIKSGAVTCPHCDTPSWADPGIFEARSVATPFTVLKESGVIAALGLATVIMGVAIAFLEPAYGAILIGIGLIAFLFGRVK